MASLNQNHLIFLASGEKETVHDSSEEEGAHLTSPVNRRPPRPSPPTSKSTSTQTTATMLDTVNLLAERFGLTTISMDDVKNQFWAHILACLKMPRGGVNGGGSMHCAFEFVAPNETCVRYLMHLPVNQNQRYNLSLPPHVSSEGRTHQYIKNIGWWHAIIS
jgi:hypothetical protein